MNRAEGDTDAALLEKNPGDFAIGPATAEQFSGLKAVGPKLFVETPASGQPIVACPGEKGTGTIMSGFTEESNVNIVEELMQLRTLQSWKKVVEQTLMTIQEGNK